MNKITGIVIAGGKSSRMGQNKALIKYGSIRLIDNAIEILQNFTQNILISSNVSIQNVSYPIISDEFKNIGPIGGLYSSLKESKSELNIIIPCDVPNVNIGLYNKMIELCVDVDAVIPELPNGKLEPLIACYKKKILPIIDESICNNDYKLVNLLLKIKVRYIDVLDIEQFKNINSPEDLL